MSGEFNHGECRNRIEGRDEGGGNRGKRPNGEKIYGVSFPYPSYAYVKVHGHWSGRRALHTRKKSFHSSCSSSDGGDLPFSVPDLLGPLHALRICTLDFSHYDYVQVL